MPRRKGSPWKLGVTPEMRFDANLRPTDSGCVEWAGHLLPNGYGTFGFEGRAAYAHRYAYQRAHGSIPAGLFVLHRCDNPRCVAPAHLFAGTQKDNMIDCSRKGRVNRTIEARMEDHPQAKITEAIAVETRSLHAKGVRQCDIAARFGVSKYIISRVVLNKTWKGAKA